MKSAINFTTVTPNFRGRLLLLIRNSGIMLITFLGWTDASYVPGTDYGDLKIIHRDYLCNRCMLIRVFLDP